MKTRVAGPGSQESPLHPAGWFEVGSQGPGENMERAAFTSIITPWSRR